MNDGRYDGIQVLRLLAALLVVATHSFFYLHERTGFDFLWNNGARGVDIFFVISGFVIIFTSQKSRNGPPDWKDFMMRRVFRIAPMYWLVTTLKVGIMLLVPHLVYHADLDFIKIIGSYFFIPHKKLSGHIEPTLGVGWTLTFEMFFYIVFSVALRLKLNVYAFVGGVMVLMSLLSLLRPDDVPATMFLFDPIVLEFFFGMVLGHLALQGRLLPPAVAGVLALACLAQLLFVKGGDLPRILVAGVPAVLLVYCVLSLEVCTKGKIPKALLFLGAASYAMYLIHPLVLPAVPILLAKYSNAGMGVSIGLSLMTALAAASLVYKFVERPLDGFLHRKFIAPRKLGVLGLARP